MRKDTRYAVTERRILNARTGLANRFTAIGLGTLPGLDLTERRDGRGTIRFGQPVSPGWNTGRSGGWSPASDPTPQFLLAIEDAGSGSSISSSARSRAERWHRRSSASRPRPRRPKRLNRTVGVAEALSGALDPALKKRGFASRDIFLHWRAMAPAPYDRLAVPDKLAWPRGERGAGGATLYLRCAEGQRLALAHEGSRVAAAVNRYFGYVLVNEVRLAAMPFSPGSGAKAEPPAEADPVRRALVAHAVNGVGDPGLREALRDLGHKIATRKS